MYIEFRNYAPRRFLGSLRSVCTPTLMKRSLIEYQRLPQPSVDSETECGKEVASDCRSNSKYTAHFLCPLCRMPARHGWCTVGMPSWTHFICAQKQQNVNYQDTVSNTEILMGADMESSYAMFECSHHRWACHVLRKSNDRLSKEIFYSERKNGNRSHWRRRERYKDTLKWCSIDSDPCEESGQL